MALVGAGLGACLWLLAQTVKHRGAPHPAPWPTCAGATSSSSLSDSSSLLSESSSSALPTDPFWVWAAPATAFPVVATDAWPFIVTVLFWGVLTDGFP